MAGSPQLCGKEPGLSQATCGAEATGRNVCSHRSGDLPVCCCGATARFLGQQERRAASHIFEVFASSIRMLLVHLLAMKSRLGRLYRNDGLNSGLLFLKLFTFTSLPLTLQPAVMGLAH